MSNIALKNIPVLQDEIINLHIESMSYDNSALARYKDFIIFVDRGAPGDIVKAQITTIKPNYARAKILEILESDQNYRIDAHCKLFKVCGGCQWQHLPYDKQLEQKDLLMKNFLSKLNLKTEILKNIISATQTLERDNGDHKTIRALGVDQRSSVWHYRNKVQYPVRTVESTDRLKAGYFEWNTNELINIKHCPIQHEKFDEIIDTVRDLAPKYKIIAYDSKKRKGWLRHICVRYGFNTGEGLLTLVAVNDKLKNKEQFANEIMKKHPELVGVSININTGTTNVIYGPTTKTILGKEYFYEKVCNLKYKISGTSFFQVNTFQAENLLNKIDEFLNLNGNEIILDAYCGGGLISLFLAKRVKKVFGIEEVEKSIEDAKSNVKENNIKNTTFIFGKVENKIIDILEIEKPDVVILDPPRAGCNKKVLHSILKNPPKKIIYVSCNPSTLVRDLEILSVNGFSVKTIQPVDMFPHTYHIECVCLLEKIS